MPAWGRAAHSDGGQPLRDVGDLPLPAVATEEDDGKVLRRWGWFAALAPLGAACMLYTVVARGFIAGDAGPGLAWPLLGVLPLFVFGMWLLTASTARSALFIAWAATAMAVGAGFETFLQMNPDVIREPWYPLLNLIGLMAATVASAAVHQHVRDLPDRHPRAAVAAHLRRVLLGPGRRGSVLAPRGPARAHAGGARRGG